MSVVAVTKKAVTSRCACRGGTCCCSSEGASFINGDEQAWQESSRDVVVHFGPPCTSAAMDNMTRLWTWGEKTGEASSASQRACLGRAGTATVAHVASKTAECSGWCKKCRGRGREDEVVRGLLITTCHPARSHLRARRSLRNRLACRSSSGSQRHAAKDVGSSRFAAGDETPFAFSGVGGSQPWAPGASDGR